MLNHTSGLHNALANLRGENPLLISDWDECLNQIAMAVPETEPGQEQLYHYLSFGWLCGGIIEVLCHAYVHVNSGNLKLKCISVADWEITTG